MTTLEILQQARRTIIEGDFEFVHWGVCTCGHIYAAALGKEPKRKDKLGISISSHSMHNAMQDNEVLEEVARALGWTPANRQFETPCVFISGMTRSNNFGDYRPGALRVIDSAIFTITSEHEAARLAVLAQAEEIVDNMTVEEIASEYIHA